MTVLDRTVFRRTVDVKALLVPVAKTQSIMKLLKNEVLDIPRTKKIYTDASDASMRLILLQPHHQTDCTRVCVYD